MKKIVVLGGGHGLSILLKGIKEIEDVDISAIVTVADDGGSTGRLRERYDIPAMGDIRNVLIALAGKKSLLGDLMAFRFEGESEEDIEGHNLGNLILTAITQMQGSFGLAINTLSDLLEVKGHILPSTLERVTLYALMDDDTIVKGEANIPSFNHHISKVFYDHDVKADEKAVKAILDADVILYGTGSLYTSILPNIIMPGMKEALAKTNAKRVYFANCMTQDNETFDYDLDRHVEALLYHGAPVDLIIRHNDVIPDEIRQHYLESNSIEVVNGGSLDIEVQERNLLDFSSGLVRHDPAKIRVAVEKLLEEL